MPKKQKLFISAISSLNHRRQPRERGAGRGRKGQVL